MIKYEENIMTNIETFKKCMKDEADAIYNRLLWKRTK